MSHRSRLCKDEPLDDNHQAVVMSQSAALREIKINSALASLSKAIISPGITTDEMCQMVLDQARALTESQHGFVSSIEPITCAHFSNTLTKMRKEGCTVSASLYALPEQPHNHYNGLWGYALNTGKAFFTNTPQSHPASGGLPCGHLPLTNYLAVPAIFGGELVGQIALANSPRDYHADDIWAVERLAELYAIVLHNRRREEELERLATTDYLTELLNRRHFIYLGRKEFDRFRRYKNHLSVIIMDLDHFKRINDKHGHQAGDGVLAEVGKLLLRHSRDVDIIGRLGGEEFGIVLPETSLQEGSIAAERMRADLSGHEFTMENGKPLFISASFGVTEALAADASFDVTINRADQLLYKAKAMGRNQVAACSQP